MTEFVELEVSLGSFIDTYRYDAELERLYISGPALEEGVWTGVNGIPIFYPVEVIHQGAKLFEGLDLVCDHLSKPIGKIVSIELTEFGFDVKEAYITHKPTIDAVLSGEKRGFSIKAVTFVEPIRKIAESIVKAEHISLVDDPACRVCGITRAYSTKGNTDMTDHIQQVENGSPMETEAPIEASTEASTEDTPISVEAKLSAFEELTIAVNKFTSALKKMEQRIAGNKSEDVVPEASQEVVTEAVVETSAEIPVEIPVEATKTVGVTSEVTEVTTVGVSDVVESTSPIEVEPAGIANIEPSTLIIENSAGPAETVTTEQKDIEAELSEIKIALSALTSTISNTVEGMNKLVEHFDTMELALSSAHTEVEQYREKADSLEVQLSSFDSQTRTELVSEITKLDPAGDTSFIEGLTVAQLSTYKSTVERLAGSSKISVGARKSVKRDEAVEVSLSAKTHADDKQIDRKKLIAEGLIPFLEKQQ